MAPGSEGAPLEQPQEAGERPEHGDERQRPNPFTPPAESAAAEADEPAAEPDAKPAAPTRKPVNAPPRQKAKPDSKNPLGFEPDDL